MFTLSFSLSLYGPVWRSPPQWLVVSYAVIKLHFILNTGWFFLPNAGYQHQDGRGASPGKVPSPAGPWGMQSQAPLDARKSLHLTQFSEVAL